MLRNERSNAPRMKQCSEVLTDPPPRHNVLASDCHGPRLAGNKTACRISNSNESVLPQLCLRTCPCPGSFWQPWAPSRRLGGRSLCPLAELPLSAATLQGPHTGPSGDGFIPALSLADDGEDSSKGAHCGLVIGVWCLPLGGIQGRDATTPGRALRLMVARWNGTRDLAAIMSLLPFFPILYILREVSRLAFSCPVLFIQHSHSLEASFFSSAKITA